MATGIAARSLARGLGALVVLVFLFACGGDDPARGPDPSEPSTATSARDDRLILRDLAVQTAAVQRPDESVTVGGITFFDDPEGCSPPGEAALVTVEFQGEPTRGDILFCRTDAGWKVGQGILYGE